MTKLLQRLHDELVRRNYATSTRESYLRIVHAHARRSLFQLHSRPPRQRLPSSLVIEGVSAQALSCSSSYSRRDTSDNANDKAGVILPASVTSSPLDSNFCRNAMVRRPCPAPC